MNGKVMRMKKRALRKDFYMEIRKTWNRFLSIFLIVAMGAAFYSGIQAAAPDMRKTGDAYFDRKQLADAKVIGTMGMTQEDVLALSQTEGVSVAEPGYMTDVLCGDEKSKQVLHVESLLPTINQVTVTEGALPEKENECLMDEEFAKANGYQVGDSLAIREEVEDGQERMLKKQTLTITGLGNSPAYISFGRGSTTLGTGEVSGFLYVPEKAFDSEVYTQVWILAEGAGETQAFTDAYQELVDGLVVTLEDMQQQRCQIRLDQVKADAEEELEEAQKELEDGKREAEEELADAKEQIQDGKKQLKDGKKQMEDGERQLADAKTQLRTKEQELANAKAQVEDGEAKLSQGKQQLAENQAKYDTEAASAQKTIQEGEQALKAGKKQLSEGKKEYEAGQKQFRKGEQEYQSKLAAYEKSKAEYESGLSQYEQGEAQYVQGKASYDSQLAKYQAAVQAGMPIDSQEMKNAKAKLDQAKQQLDTTRATLDATKRQLEAGKVQLDAAKPQLDQAGEQIAATRKQLEASKKKLDSSEKTIKEKEAQLEEGKKELSDGKKALESARSQIASQEAQLQSAKEQIARGETQIAEGWETLKQEEQKLADGKKEIEENQKKLKDAREEYRQGKRDARKEIEKGEQELANARQDMEELKLPEWYITDRSDFPDYSAYGDNADRVSKIGEVFPVLFFLVAALISLTTMTRMVEEERIQIGTLKALGYGKTSIACKYLCYAFLATLGGGVFGILVGEKILPYIIVRAYGVIYHEMGEVLLPYHMDYAAIAILASLLCTMGATIAACRHALADTPSNLMRPPAPKQGKRVLLERIPFLWKRLNFTWKSTFRNLLRYKKRFFMTIFGIGGCMALILVGFGLQDSIMNIAKLQYQQIQTYDSLVVLKEDASQEQIEQLKQELDGENQVERYGQIYMKMLDLYNGKKEVNVYLMVPEEAQEFQNYVHFRDRKTRQPYQLGDDGILLSEKTAKLLDVSVGDTLDLAQTGETPKEVTVMAICENYLSHYAYMTPALYEKLYGEEPDYRTLILKMKEGVTQEEIEQTGERMLSGDAALSVSYTATLEDQLHNMLSSLDTVIAVLIISAGMLAFVVLYNLNNININERKRELATLKVLGFYDMEVGAYVYRENILLTLIGSILGAGLGVLLHRFVIVTVEVDICMFGRNINPDSFLYAVLFTFAFSAIVNAAMFFKLKKIDMVESLKSVE